MSRFEHLAETCELLINYKSATTLVSHAYFLRFQGSILGTLVPKQRRVGLAGHHGVLVICWHHSVPCHHDPSQPLGHPQSAHWAASSLWGHGESTGGGQADSIPSKKPYDPWFSPSRFGAPIPGGYRSKDKASVRVIPGGAETVRCETTSGNSRMGPVPPTGHAERGYPCWTRLSSWLRTIWWRIQVQTGMVLPSLFPLFLSGVSASAPCQEDRVGGEGSMVFSLGDFTLEKARDETLIHAFN